MSSSYKVKHEIFDETISCIASSKIIQQGLTTVKLRFDNVRLLTYHRIRKSIS